MRDFLVLMVGKIWPEPRASAASTRVIDLARAVLAAGARLVFTADAQPTPATAAMEAMGAVCVRLAPNDPAFDRYVGELAPDLAIFDTYTSEEKFGWRVRAVAPKCLRVLDTIDLHGLRLGRERAVAEGRLPLPDVATLLSLAGDTALREVAAIYRCDLSLIVSDYEMRVLTEHCGVPPELLQLCRLGYAPPPVPQPFAARRGYVTIGSFRHPPNVDGLTWLRQAIWPRIRARQPDAQLSAFGSYARREHLALSAPEHGFRVLGLAPDQFTELARARVGLAPLRFGAGIKGKIADSWWCGTPVVTTAIGAEGMTQGLPFGGAVCDDPEVFADAAVRLYNDERAWSDASADGARAISSLYSFEATVDAALARMRALARAGERPGSFTSRMLWQQALRSTEFFSRWIEAKQTLARSGGGKPLS